MVRPSTSPPFPYTTLFRSPPERPARRRTGDPSFDRQRAIVERSGRPIAQTLAQVPDRKSTRLNSSHLVTSYAVCCLTIKRSSGEDYTLNTTRRNSKQSCTL